MFDSNAFVGALHPYQKWSPGFVPVRQAKSRLLLLGKDELSATALRAHVAAFGWEVDCSYELEEAEALLSCFTYSVVVTDLSLRGVDGPAGLKIVEQVRARYPYTRVFLWTSFYSTQLEEAAQECGGVDGFLPKPFPLKYLARAVCVASEPSHA
jgi:ActR/RegA family two-component response regulator